MSTAFTAPLTNEPYSKVSGDFSPIHINPYFSNYAPLPVPLRMDSAATCPYVETIAAKGHPERYGVNFVGMVIPGEPLMVNIRHTGMRDGNMAVRITTIIQRGEKALQGSAEVAQPTAVCVSTRQGLQEPGMGMGLYNRSLAARAVWGDAGAHLLAVYDFSIIKIVKGNPNEKTIHFGGIEGQAIRQRYMDMTYDATVKGGPVKASPLFADIDVRAPKYTYSHPNGLLVVNEKAAFEDMRIKGFLQKDCAFAGHSLGEHSALASIADVLHISAVVHVVFYRGIIMQRAVECDSENRSNYAMCACQQHVCAGELLALQIKTNIINYLKIQKIDVAKLTETFTVEKVKEMLADVVKSCLVGAVKSGGLYHGSVALRRFLYPVLMRISTPALCGPVYSLSVLSLNAAHSDRLVGKANYEARDGFISTTRAIICHSKNAKEIYYQYEDEAEGPPAQEELSPTPTAAPTILTPVPAAPVALAPSRPRGKH
ncbi:hypothetical protein CVT26_003048 [Gymnopilus dilepis]|uniref:MaoC-like domain-containing protein n=1 Tax=Gymnopilus dilepis TaxID=231916 RepID=A0A409Y4Y3_9AGAR|nr:hypothetical protein CVT26_003048 [Gymnopilus dilepis]